MTFPRRQFYKVVSSDGRAFFGTDDFDYGTAVGYRVYETEPQDPRSGLRMCTVGILHAWDKLYNACQYAKQRGSWEFRYGNSPRLFLVEGQPVCREAGKYGFFEYDVLKEFKQRDRKSLIEILVHEQRNRSTNHRGGYWRKDPLSAEEAGMLLANSFGIIRKGK